MRGKAFTIGAQVVCQNGKCGKLSKIAVDPETWEVRDLIVEEGFLLKRARVFPISLVESATPDEICLALDAEELPNYREYEEDQYESLANGMEGVPLSRPEVPPHEAAMQVVNTYNETGTETIPLVREKIRKGVDSDLELVEHGTPVIGIDGEMGKLDRVITDSDTGKVTHLVMRHGFLSADHTLIPVTLVEHIGENGIGVKASKEGLEEITDYSF
jgi:uncharacterized protein YrrD